MPAKKHIPPEQRERIKKLASLGLSDTEIALVEGLSRRTMETRCRDELVQGRIELKMRLHRIQWTLAERSATMAIFLGKQYLGQKDVPVPPEQKGTIIEYVQNVIVTTKQANMPAVEDKASASLQALPPASEQIIEPAVENEVVCNGNQG
jgi:hypothetical protein